MSGSIVPHRGAFRWLHGDEWHCLYNTDFEKAADVANMLWRENIASVSARYPNESSATLPGPVGENFTITPNDISTWDCVASPVQVLKSCDCYEYQSCEHPGWKQSEAKQFIDALRREAWHALPGYDDAEWGSPKSKQHA
jgi:hypothetical protein